MKKREADFGVLLRHWVMANPLKHTATFETKQTTGSSIPFSCFESNQIIYAQAIRESPKGVFIRVQGTSGEPDYIYLYKEPSFVVIRYPKTFHVIGVDAFLIEREKSKRKSLTEDRARAISVISVDL